MKFSEVLGHDLLKEKLVQMVAQARLPHALLFLGKRGNGAFPLALALAQFILCSNKKNNDACGDCPSCSSVKEMVHPDLFYTFPVFNKTSDKKYTSKDFINEFKSFIGKKPYSDVQSWIQSLTKENKQANISAEECSELSRKMMLRPILGGAKILIIWYAELLGHDGNRLLKLIEEPPKNSYIFFIAEDADKMLETILSRTQLIALKPYRSEQIEKALIQKGLSNAKAKQVALIAEGNFDYASEKEQYNDVNHYEFMRAWLNALFTNSVVDLHKWTYEADQLSKENIKVFYQYALKFFEETIRFKFHSNESILPLDKNEIEIAKGLIKRNLNEEKLKQLSKILESCIYHLERNVYKKLLIYTTNLESQEVLLSK